MISNITLLAAGQTGGSWLSILPMVILLLAFYFILIRPQQKKEKKDAEMRKNIQIGDEVITAGGIVGIVCKIDDDNDTLVIETAGDRSHIRIKRWAISQNLDAAKQAAEANAKAKAEKTSKAEKEIEKKD